MPHAACLATMVVLFWVIHMLRTWYRQSRVRPQRSICVCPISAKGRFIVADSTGKQFTADADSAPFARSLAPRFELEFTRMLRR